MLTMKTCPRVLSFAGVWLALLCASASAQYPNFALDLPARARPNRVSLVGPIEARSKKTYAALEGPGCIRHIWCTSTRNDFDNRKVVIRIFFDDEKVPYVEAPFGDFFGVMHGKAWYPINTALLSVQAKSGYNCYFPMPFAKSARLEFETGDDPSNIYCQVDWHSYPAQTLRETKRFCARWRREFPTTRYDEDFLLMDADGSGQLVGFVYGVRLLDNVDRWSHGGSDNIYIDGDGPDPAYLRGIGGEDTFGTSYGGATHIPGTHLNAEMPYYFHEDVGEARPAQNVVGYRWFLNDTIEFDKSIHIRFGCMSNDICATAYWYQHAPVRPYAKLPSFELLTPGRYSKEVPRGSCDLALPDTGTWWISPASDEALLTRALQQPLKFDEKLVAADWVQRSALRGFVDFGHVHRPEKRGAGVFYEGAAAARSVIEAPQDMTATFQLAWEDRLVLRVNEGQPLDLGHRDHFGKREVQVPLRAGRNVIEVALSNTRNFNHGGWTFVLRATTPAGEMLLPRAK